MSTGSTALLSARSLDTSGLELLLAAILKSKNERRCVGIKARIMMPFNFQPLLAFRGPVFAGTTNVASLQIRASNLFDRPWAFEAIPTVHQSTFPKTKIHTGHSPRIRS